MHSHEPDLPGRSEETDDNLGPIPVWFHPTPEKLERLVEMGREDPDWSREALEEMVLALRMRIAQGYDVEATVKQFRTMAERHLPKKE